MVQDRTSTTASASPDRDRHAGSPLPFRADRRASIALMTAAMTPAILLAAALIVDGGFWLLCSTQLQVAADAAAMGAAQLLATNLAIQAPGAQTAAYTNVALFEARQAAPKLAATINASAVTVAAGNTSVSVTLTSQAPGFLNAVSMLVPPFTLVTPPLLSATATATVRGGPKPCILELGLSGDVLDVSGGATVTARTCPIYVDSSGTPAIHVAADSTITETGTINGTDIGAVGTIAADSAGSIGAGTISPGGNLVQDPIAGMVSLPPLPPLTSPANGYNSSGITYNLIPTVWNGDVAFGNGANVNFASGTYFINNGSLNFNGANVDFAPGVTLVLTGTNPGNLNWVNGSGATIALAAPTAGLLTGIAIWMSCNASGNQTASFAGGSTLSVAGAIYMPCANATVGNKISLTAALCAQFSLISRSLTVSGNAAVTTSGGCGTSTTNAAPVLTQ